MQSSLWNDKTLVQDTGTGPANLNTTKLDTPVQDSQKFLLIFVIHLSVSLSPAPTSVQQQ